ncbi:type I glyceraldehyde-3-phosphate dehydrogenase [Candidatus Babeliales bacterium]|nr:type I glyceraldehyde-3-phosphate dehydrogenase [Candidatus Babeliales bacterium]
MSKKIAINGFGRIGKTFLRTLLQDKKNELEVVAINLGPGNPELAAHLFKYDSIMGKYQGSIEYKSCKNKDYTGILKIDGFEIKILSELNPLKTNWKNLEIDWVVESSGAFTKREKSELHLKSGAKKVLITAPSTNEDITIIPGVNDNQYKPDKHFIISLGSCTSNCFAPIIKVLKENFTILNGFMTTIHAYTNDQVLLDIEHKDPRRARAAALNMIPTKTGADKVIVKIYPDLEKKLKGQAIRVPTPVVSLVDFTFTTDHELTTEKINQTFKKYSQNELKGILEYCEEPLVSKDFEQNSHSCIIDSFLTQSLGKISKVFGWYDNEFGYCCRLKDFLLHN